MNRVSWVPITLTLFRFAVGLVFVLLGWAHASPALLIALLAAGLASDIADGIIARRLGIATLALRKLDTQADLVFYSGAAVAAFLRTPTLFSIWLPWLAGYLGLYVARNTVDFCRYRASPAYHMWSGKLWSVLIFMCLVTAFLGVAWPWLYPAAFAFYAFNAVEGIVASLVFKEPRRDVPSVWHALASRRKAEATPTPEPYSGGSR